MSPDEYHEQMQAARSELTLFDDPQAVTEEAIQRVEDHAAPTWLEEAYNAGVGLARIRSDFSSDDIWQWMEDYYPDVTTHEPRAMGAVIRSLKRNGIIAVEPKCYVKSARVQSHLRPIPRHSSLLFAR